MTENLEEKVRKTKEICLQMCIGAGAGHVTSAFSCAEIVATLYYDIMNIDPQNPTWSQRDRFVMSKNHGSVITYPILADLGFFPTDMLSTFLKNGSILGAHTKMSIPGVEFAGGSLGIGIGVATGMAYAAKHSGDSWNTFCLVGDGECYEGSVWEAALFAGHNKLNNLVVIVDRNKMCVTDFTEHMLALDPLDQKWESFGWEVRKINGHSIQEIRTSLHDIRNRQEERPLCIIADTIKGHGISFMENNVFMHGVAPSGEKAELALKMVKGEAL